MSMYEKNFGRKVSCLLLWEVFEIGWKESIEMYFGDFIKKDFVLVMLERVVEVGVLIYKKYFEIVE